MRWIFILLIHGTIQSTLEQINIRNIIKSRNRAFDLISNHTKTQLESLESFLTDCMDSYSLVLLDTNSTVMEKSLEILYKNVQKFTLSVKSQEHLIDSKQEDIKVGNKSLVDHLLQDVKEQAQTVENSKQDEFIKKQSENNTSIETVIKVPDSEDSHVLIDSSNNHYVLSKTGDMFASVQDTVFFQDVSFLLIACFISVMILYLLQLPSFFGYILAGIIMSQNKQVVHEVQVETISRGLGVTCIMFFLGLEFNIQKIKRVWTISFIGSFLLLFFTIGTVLLIGFQFNAKIQESLVIGSCIFLSSTAVVMHLLQNREMELGYGRSIMGILVCQDIMLGFLLAIMPVLKSSGMELLLTLGRLISFLVLFLLLSFLISYPFQYALQTIQHKKEVFCLGGLAYCFIIAEVGDLCEQSLELSCFVAGMMLASKKPLAEAIGHSLESLRDIFASLFFASIGLHIYPTFLINEGLLILSLTIVIVFLKIMITTIVIHIFFKRDWRNSFVIGVGLGQISEFTFVLASKAKRYHCSNTSQNLLTREAFFLMIGITTMSMIVSPLLWSLVSKWKKGDSEPMYPDVEHVLISFDKDSVKQE